MPEEPNTLNKHQSFLKRLQEYNIQSLERKELGVFGFSQALPTATKIVSHSNLLSIECLGNLPPQRQKIVGNACNEVLTKFDQIIQFNHNQQNPTHIRDSYLAELEQVYNSFLENTLMLFTLSLSNQSSVEQTEDKIKTLLSNIEIQSSNLQKAAKEKLDEANTLIESIKNASAKEGTLKQASYFRNEKDYHRTRAKWWSAGTIASALVLILYTVFSFNMHKWFGIDLAGDNQKALLWQIQTTKFLIFAILAYLLVLSVRNFMAHKHNMVINSHRETALCTFEALANAANQDEGARDIILNHAAACIFTPQDTGYTKSHSNDTGTNLGSASLIVNLAKQAVGKD